jgi:glycosyl transferase family 25
VAFTAIDAVLYINLTHRKDRCALITDELKKLGVSQDKILRIDAEHDLLNGHRGCALSHKKALEKAQARKFNRVLILEDDATFVANADQIDITLRIFFEEFQQDWDVFFLGANILEAKKTHLSNIYKVVCAQCAHGYIVNASYYSTLIRLYEQVVDSMQDDFDVVDSWYKALDQKWKVLQQQDRWYVGPIFCQQRRSYSDIEHQIRDRRHENTLGI